MSPCAPPRHFKSGLLLTILQNEIQDFFLSFVLSTLGSERVKLYLF